MSCMGGNLSQCYSYTQGTQPSPLHLLIFSLLFEKPQHSLKKMTCWQLYCGTFVCRELLTCVCASLTRRQEGCRQLCSMIGPGEPPVTEINQRHLGRLCWEIREGSAGRGRVAQCRALLQGESRTGPAIAATDAGPVELNGC